MKDKQLDYESQLNFYTVLRRNTRFTTQLLSDDIRKQRSPSRALQTRNGLIGGLSAIGGLFLSRSLIASAALGLSATFLDYYLAQPTIL